MYQYHITEKTLNHFKVIVSWLQGLIFLTIWRQWFFDRHEYCHLSSQLIHNQLQHPSSHHLIQRRENQTRIALNCMMYYLRNCMMLILERYNRHEPRPMLPGLKNLFFFWEGIILFLTRGQLIGGPNFFKIGAP